MEKFISRRMVLGGLAVLPVSFVVGRYIGEQLAGLEDRKVECTSQGPAIIFETEYSKATEDSIVADFDQLPDSVKGRFNKYGFRVVVLASEAAVGARYGGSAGGIADYGKKQIVIGPAVDFPHELGHVVDFIYGDLSMSLGFLRPAVISFKRSQTRSISLKKDIQDLYDKEKDEQARSSLATAIARLNQDEDLLARVDAVSNLSQSQVIEKIYGDGALQDYVRHMYTPGFEQYYSLDGNTRKRFRDTDPELYSAFDDFDSRMRQLCPA